MAFQGELTDIEVLIKRTLTKLIAELRRGIFSDAKLDLAYTNPDEFFAEYLAHMDEDTRREVVAGIKHTIVTGFFRTTVRAALADNAENN